MTWSAVLEAPADRVIRWWFDPARDEEAKERFLAAVKCETRWAEWLEDGQRVSQVEWVTRIGTEVEHRTVTTPGRLPDLVALEQPLVRATASIIRERFASGRTTSTRTEGLTEFHPRGGGTEIRHRFSLTESDRSRLKQHVRPVTQFAMQMRELRREARQCTADLGCRGTWK
jgi:hypothetical protein